MNRNEFEKSLDNAEAFWGDRSFADIKDKMGNDVAKMYGFEQNNPHHCFDLFRHTLVTVDNLNPEADKYLAVAAFFHDIGKPAVAMAKNGHLVFYGHAEQSAALCKKILRELEYSDEEIELVSFYVIHHDDFISYVLPSEEWDRSNPFLVEINETNIRKYICKTVAENQALFKRQGIYNIFANLLELCVADIRAQANMVYKNKCLVDSKEHKLSKIRIIRNLVDNMLLHQ